MKPRHSGQPRAIISFSVNHSNPFKDFLQSRLSWRILNTASSRASTTVTTEAPQQPEPGCFMWREKFHMQPKSNIPRRVWLVALLDEVFQELLPYIASCTSNTEYTHD